MPTYQNRSGEIVTVGEDMFAPFEVKKMKRPVLIEGTSVVLTDIAPLYNPYEIVIKSGKLNSKSKPWVHTNSKIIRVDTKFPEADFTKEISSTPNNSGTSLTLGLFGTVGIPTNLSTYQLLRTFKFITKSGFWCPETSNDFKIPVQILDRDKEVFYLQILELSGSTVDISLKNF